MSDEDLRHLERASQAHPHDGELGWRYARALERGGRRRDYLVELARLARLGDAAAQAVLHDLVALRAPGLQRSRGRRCAPLREPLRIRDGAVDCPHQAAVLAATEGVLYVQNDEALVAIDTLRLVELWRRRRGTHAPFALRGEDVVIAEGRDLVLLDGLTGVEVARSRQLGTITEIAAEGDRAVLHVGANDERLWLLVGVDFGRAFGERLWKHISPRSEGPRTIQGIIEKYVLCGEELVPSRLEDGESDVRGLEVARGLSFRHDAEPRLLHAAENGAWRASVEFASPPECGALRLTGPDRSVHSIDLPPLTSPIDPTVCFQRMDWPVAMSSVDACVLATPLVMEDPLSGEPRDGDDDFVNVLVVDLESASVRFDLGLPADLCGEFHHVEGIALDGALLVVVTTPEGCRLFRIEAKPGA